MRFFLGEKIGQNGKFVLDVQLASVESTTNWFRLRSPSVKERAPLSLSIHEY